MTKTRRTVSLVAAAAVLFALAGSAMAQSSDEEARPPATPAKATKGKVKVLTIEEERVEGEVPSGTIIPVDARGFASRDSLIRYRYSFVDKILQSAEQL